MSDGFFLEAHPQVKGLLLLIPYAPIIALCAAIIQQSWVGFKDIMALLPAIVPGYTILMDSGYETWSAEGYVEMTMLLIVAITTVIAIIYAMLWSYIFPRYTIRYGTHTVADGRMYWADDNWFVRTWDAWYGSPPRPVINRYVNHGLIFHPGKLTKITSTLEEKGRREGYNFIVDEKPSRIIVGPRHIATSDEVMPHINPDLAYTREVFRQRSEELTDATCKLSIANPHIRTDMMRDSSYYEDPRVFNDE